VKRASIVLLALVCSGLSAPLFPNGWDNSIMGARATGMASAFAGLADDATAIFYNPGGLAFTRDRGEIIVVAKQYFPEHTYTTPEGERTVSRNPTFLPELFVYRRLGERLAVGLGIYTPYAGGGIEWQAQDVGLHVDGAVAITSFSPTVSYKITDWLAAGLNLNGYYAQSDQSYENPSAGPTEPSAFSSDEEDFKFSYSAGLFVKPGDRWSAGVTYHAPSSMNLNGSAELDTLIFSGTYDSATRFQLPFWTAVGAAWHATEDWTLTAEWDWFDWSRMDSLEKTIYGTPFGDLSEEQFTGFQDSYYLQFGTEYTLSERFTLRGGASYERTAMDPAYLSLTNVDATKYHLFAGRF
jgi:long-chain fatty acid transport protein